MGDNGVVYFDCNVPSGNDGIFVASCHTGECRSSEQACLAARGQPVEGRGCTASKTVCESKGFTFKPLTQSMIDNVPTSHMSTCCGGSSNVKSPLSLTQYVKDGFVDSAPAPGACVKSSCCGEGTVWQEGAGCIPTRSGMIDACKAKRGKWAWTCDAEEFCSS